MVLLAAVVIPHGAMPFDGDEHSQSEAVRERYSRLNPDFRATLSKVLGVIVSLFPNTSWNALRTNQESLYDYKSELTGTANIA